jgi:ATP-dependent protease ClpP protease subunit
MLVNDIGSILDGYEAVECGLIDEVGGIKEAIAYLKGEKKFSQN